MERQRIHQPLWIQQIRIGKGQQTDYWDNLFRAFRYINTFIYRNCDYIDYIITANISTAKLVNIKLYRNSLNYKLTFPIATLFMFYLVTAIIELITTT